MPAQRLASLAGTCFGRLTPMANSRLDSTGAVRSGVIFACFQDAFLGSAPVQND